MGKKLIFQSDTGAVYRKEGKKDKKHTVKNTSINPDIAYVVRRKDNQKRK